MRIRHIITLTHVFRSCMKAFGPHPLRRFWMSLPVEQAIHRCTGCKHDWYCMPLPNQLRTSSFDSTFALQQSYHWPEPYRCTETKHIPCHLLRLSPQQFQAMFLYRCTFDLADQHFTITDCKRNNRQNLTHNKHTRASKHMHSALLIAISGNDAIHIHGCQQCQPIMGRHSNSLSQATHLYSWHTNRTKKILFTWHIYIHVAA